MITPQILFIGGLHRSGTSIVHRAIASHPQVSGFRDTGVFEDEGQHLQTVFPKAHQVGGPGRFALNPAAHLDENSPLVTPENRSRLIEEWGRHWDMGAAVCVEKSPPNVIRSRFLQALFPDAAFLILLRHPVAVTCATQKWTHTTWTSLIKHWAVCHEIMDADVRHLRNVQIMRYEDFVADPDGAVAEVYLRLDLPPHPVSVDIRSGVNDRYFRAWNATRNPIRLADRATAVSRFEERVRPFGYSLADTALLSSIPDRTRVA